MGGGCCRDETLGKEITGRDEERDRDKETKRRETLFIHSFNKYLMSVCYMPGTVLGAGDTVDVETDKVLASMEFIF